MDVTDIDCELHLYHVQLWTFLLELPCFRILLPESFFHAQVIIMSMREYRRDSVFITFQSADVSYSHGRCANSFLCTVYGSNFEVFTIPFRTMLRLIHCGGRI
jgi:hypothetical protein